MTLIFSADRNWGIGRENRLLFRTKGDMAFFRRTTENNAVVMGRKTLESFPGSAPLPNRDNIVLSRNYNLGAGLVSVCKSLPELFALLRRYRDDQIFIIGGAQIYRQMMPYCEKALVTRWDAVAEDADSFAPNLDEAPDWTLGEQSDPITEDGLTYRFCTYVQQNPGRWRMEVENLVSMV